MPTPAKPEGMNYVCFTPCYHARRLWHRGEKYAARQGEQVPKHFLLETPETTAAVNGDGPLPPEPRAMSEMLPAPPPANPRTMSELTDKPPAVPAGRAKANAAK